MNNAVGSKPSEAVKNVLEQLRKEVPQLPRELEQAERLADQFSEIKPVPYNVPIERFAGLAFNQQKNDC